MNDYNEFVNHLYDELNKYKEVPFSHWQTSALLAVDGFASEELRRLVDLDIRRKFGAFFTNSELATRVLSSLQRSLNRDSLIYDPACGAGNLLIAVSNILHLLLPDPNFSPNLFGTDINAEFVEAAKIRLQINDLLKNKNDSLKSLDAQYQILKSDGLINNQFYANATHVILNPPFNLIDSDESFNWAKGKVSAAAVFVDKAIDYVNNSTSIIAILPEVLRSGSRYEKWRATIREKCRVDKLDLLGQFDKYADIDVFALYLRKKRKALPRLVQSNLQIIKRTESFKSRVEDLFDVCVGPVVDNRDPKEGETLRYVVSKGLKGWEKINEFDLTRKHKGKSFKGPFIVIKRTSRMQDTYRATATIINYPKPVFVDNHLIILKPKNGRIEDCWRALNCLKDARTNEWLNDHIRCRHLTVKIVSKIPLWE